MAAVGQSIAARVQAQRSTRQGAQHWLLERLTSVALVPLGLVVRRRGGGPVRRRL